MKSKWLFLILGLQLLVVSAWCNQKETSQSVQNDESYFNLAGFLFEIDDLPSSLYFYNQLIKEKELIQCYDENYVKALYRASQIYGSIDPYQMLKLMEKIKIHDKTISTMEIKDGYLITNLPPEMNCEFEQQYFKQVFPTSGLCEKDDIEFSNGQMKIKLKCCCCQKPSELE